MNSETDGRLQIVVEVMFGWLGPAVATVGTCEGKIASRFHITVVGFQFSVNTARLGPQIQSLPTEDHLMIVNCISLRKSNVIDVDLLECAIGKIYSLPT